MEVKEMIQQISNEIKNVETQLQTKLSAQDEEIKKFGTTSDKTVEQIKALEDKYDAFQKDLNELVVKANRFGQQQPGDVKSAGQKFIESEAYKAAVTANPTAPQTGLINVKGFFDVKELTAGATSGGATIRPDRMPGVYIPVQRSLFIRDLLNVTPIGLNACEFVEETGYTNNAAARADGALAAQSDLTFDVVSVPVRNISHYVVATNNILADSTELQNIIDTRLTYGLQVEEDRQILYGDGTGENLTGFMTHARVQDVGIMGTQKNQIEHIRASFTKIRLAELAATGVILSPVDWEAIELAKGSNGQYIWINVNNGGAQQLFRVPVVDTVAMQPGDFLAGAFGVGAQLRDRQQAGIRIGEPNDFFLRGKKAVMAEERICLCIQRPEAFAKGTFATA
jgi:HK97 family phage major capsid protein